MDIDEGYGGRYKINDDHQYSNALTDHQIVSVLLGNPSFIDRIPRERMTSALVDLIVNLDHRFIEDIPKEKWTEYVILCTVLNSQFNHLIEPSLITEKFIDALFVHANDVLRLLPDYLHTERHCKQAVLSNFANILHISPVHVGAVINKALLEKTSYLGGFARIKDAYEGDIPSLISLLNNAIPAFKKNTSEKARNDSLMIVYRHRLSSIDKKEFKSLCKTLGATETFRFMYGAKEAALLFPEANKRQWLQDDMQL
jgi:hypothetical protein